MKENLTLTRLSMFSCLAVICMVPFHHFSGALCVAGIWQGRIADKEDIPHVINPEQPFLGTGVYDLVPVWRLESESDAGLTFGALEAARRDSTGNFYLFDIALKTVHVVSSAGEYVRSISRAGEGPGELRTPMDVRLDLRNHVVIAETRPPKLVILDTSGALLEEWRPPLPEGTRAALYRGLPSPFGYVLSLHVRERTPDTNRERMTVEICAQAGGSCTVFTERICDQPSDSQPMHDEAASETFYCMDVAADGTVYLAPDYGSYAIQVFNPDGSKRMVIEKECRQIARTGKQLSEMNAYWRKVYERWPNPDIRLQKNERCIQDLHVMPGDSLWVETADGWYGNEEDVAVKLDIFDSQGRFARQVVYRLRIDPWDDQLFFFPDFVLLATMAADTGRNVPTTDENGGQSPESPSLICYRPVRVGR